MMFNPLLPEPEQRNVVVALRSVGWQKKPAMARVIEDIWPKVGIGGNDHLRVLICDGPLLLSWLGVFRPGRFRRRDEEILGALIASLQKALVVDRKLRDARLASVGLAAALDAITTPAFIMQTSGRIAHANRMARDMLERDPGFDLSAVLEGCAPDARQGPGEWVVQRLPNPGSPSTYLVVLDGSDAKVRARVAHAVARWRLPPKRAEVLRHVLRGDANKTIAEKLACAEVTVEAHVTALLRSSRTESRAQLAARVWTLA
jgi:DNA-binding CsgD family transcriptional regulator